MSTFHDIRDYLSIYRRYIGQRMLVVFGLTVATALTQGFGITLLLPLLRASQPGSSEEMDGAEEILHSLLSWMGIADSMPGILAFIAAVFIAKGGLSFAQGGYTGYLQSQLIRELKIGLFDAYSEMDYRYYVENNTGHFINVINEQVNRFFLSFQSFVGLLTKIVTTVSYFAFAFAIAWWFASMALAIGLVFLGLFKYLNVYVRNISRLRSREMSTLNKFLVQALQAFKYVVSTAQTGHLRDGIVGSVNRLTGYILRQQVARAFTTSLKEPLSVLLVTGLIAIQVTVFSEPIAPIFVALLLFHRGTQAIIAVQSSWQRTMDRIGSVEMVHEEFKVVTAQKEKDGLRHLSSLQEGITFENVSFAYEEKAGDVLHDLNLTIPANTTIALVGESGAGKSTLVDMLTLLLPPRDGTIRIDGIPHTEVNRESWRSQIGYVSQETVVFDDTIANNICLWRGEIEEDADLRNRVHNAAKRAYADHFIRQMPDGYQTVIGDKGVRLSGGQRQRLFVARELFKRPNLLLLDEATSALDTESERYIQQSIDELKGEMTVVIISHRLSTIRNVDYVYVLDSGEIVEQGTYTELYAREQSQFRSMVELQSL